MKLCLNVFFFIYFQIMAHNEQEFDDHYNQSDVEDNADGTEVDSMSSDFDFSDDDNGNHFRIDNRPLRERVQDLMDDQPLGVRARTRKRTKELVQGRSDSPAAPQFQDAETPRTTGIEPAPKRLRLRDLPQRQCSLKNLPNRTVYYDADSEDDEQQGPSGARKTFQHLAERVEDSGDEYHPNDSSDDETVPGTTPSSRDPSPPAKRRPGRPPKASRGRAAGRSSSRSSMISSGDEITPGANFSDL